MIELPDWLKLIKGSLEDGNDEVDLLMCEPVGFDPETYTGMSSQRFGEILGMIPKEKVVNLLLNTVGGFVNEGVAMYNLIKQRGKVNVCVIGYAASMGAVIMQAGAKRTMCQGAMVLVHPISGGTDDAEGKKIKEVLTSNIVDILAKRTGNRRNVIAAMMESSTVMGPEDAKKMGFCDEIRADSPAKNSIDPATAFTNFQRLTSAKGAVSGQRGGKAAENEQQENSMKDLLKLLAKLKLIGSADLTEDQAVAQVETNYGAVVKERDDAKNELKTEKDRQASDMKTRVANAVKKAVADKLIKADRETNIVARYEKDEAGLTEYLNDLSELAKDSKPAPGGNRRPPAGAPPVPPAKEGGEKNEVEENDQKIADLQERMKTESPSARMVTAREIRNLRGCGKGFYSDAK